MFVRNFSVLMLFGFLFLAAEPSEASKGCWCWIGIERGERIIDYGSVDRFRDTETGKKRKCSEACSKRCAADLGNPEKLCSEIGKDFNNSGKVGCFSVVGAKDSKNNTWDYDGRPRPFSCSRCCECDRGWYDKNRRSCVEGRCDVPGMPNGDKGGGYFAWDQKLFQNVRGARCQTVTGKCPAKEEAEWTPWLNRDNQAGTGDFETLKDFRDRGQACANPIDIQCRTRRGQVPSSQTGEVYLCKASVGGVCDNRQQPAGGRCSDYEVRFLCPK